MKEQNTKSNTKHLEKKQEPTSREWGIINPFRKEPKNNDRCGINREKNPCGDASDY
ncbi:MAG: hypothetical protein HWE22_15380 [Flavobacteriales bacterium]|nr:hypothetical protein [Flavobacteriales bacterium]